MNFAASVSATYEGETHHIYDRLMQVKMYPTYLQELKHAWLHIQLLRSRIQPTYEELKLASAQRRRKYHLRISLPMRN